MPTLRAILHLFEILFRLMYLRKVLWPGGSVVQLEECWANNRTVTNPWFDFQCGSVLLRKTLNAIFYLGTK